MITILLADDHPIVRAGIIGILKADPDFIIAGEAKDGEEARQLVGELRPQILLLDLKMPGPRPAEIEQWVRTNYPETITLVLTAHDRDIYLAEMYNAGASGYISKSTRGEELIKAIHRAIEGEDLFTEQQKARIANWEKGDGHKYNILTRREREILALLCKGLDNPAISISLGIKNRTTTFHITNILKKLGVTSREQAIAWAHTTFGDDLESRVK